MSLQETTPQTQELLNSAEQELQHRIDTASPQEVYDGLMLHATEISGRTKAIESARIDGRDISEDAFMKYMDDAVEFQATAILYKEWSGLDEAGRLGFKAYVDEQARQSFDEDGNATVDAQRFRDVISASSWMDGNFEKTMKYSLADADKGITPRRPDSEFSLGSGHFMKHKIEYGNLLAEQEKAFQKEKARQEQEALETVVQQEVEIDEARGSLESLHEQTELTDFIVNFGKNKTRIVGNHERGGVDIGDISNEESKKLQDQIKKSGVNFAFGADVHSGAVRKSENSDWREAGVGERVSFIPVVEQDFRTETKTEVVEKKRFGKDVTHEVSTHSAIPGSERQKMVMNPETGQQEPAVLFTYDFDPTASTLGPVASEAIGYREFVGIRNGAYLSVVLELPSSVADKLLANIEKRPEYVREVAEALILKNTNGTVSQEDWYKGHPTSKNPIRPPYERVEELAPNWKIGIAKPKPGADIASFIKGRKGENFEVRMVEAG